MRVVNKEKLSAEGFLRICDLDDGEAFCFKDYDGCLMMATSRDGCVDIETGEVFDWEEEGWADRPVQRVLVEIIIK